MSTHGAVTGDKASVTFRLTPEVYALYYRVADSIAGGPGVTRTDLRRAGVVLGGALLLIGAALAEPVLRLIELKQYGAVAGVAVAFGLVALFAFGSFLGLVRGNRMAGVGKMLLAAGLLDVNLGEWTIRIDVDGVHVRKPHGSMFESWKAVERIASTGGVFVVRTRTGADLFIPESAFASLEAASNWLRLAQELHAAQGGGPDFATELFISARDVPCAGCGYNLRGIRGLVCPECGRKAEVAELREKEVLEAFKKS